MLSDPTGTYSTKVNFKTPVELVPGPREKRKNMV